MPESLNWQKPEIIEMPSENLELRWYADRRMVVYKLYSGDTTTVMAWSRIAVETITNWRTPKIYLAAHDISCPGVAMRYSSKFKNILLPAITDQGMQAVQQTINNPALFQARIAILVSDQFSGHITQVFAQLEKHRQKSDHILFNVFTEECSALNWLGTNLK